MTDSAYVKEIEDFIRQVFEENFDQLRLESGRAITPHVKEVALNQVLLYWKKLRETAENVTDTEVRLSLPGQESPKGREYTIEGVVDILQEQGCTLMYDIKTHDADYVRSNLDLYEQQLNVYAHIWQELRQQPLDGTAIIATSYPEAVQEALASDNPEHITYALSNWEPIVPINYDASRVHRTIAEFGKVVDDIEDRNFSPPSLEELNKTVTGTRRERFATRICRNCDARFSCTPYRQYAWTSRGVTERKVVEYFADDPMDLEQENWRTSSLDASFGAERLEADL
jgi:hypothetical protein